MQYACGHCNLAWFGLLPILVLVLNSRDCIPTKKFPELLYNFSSQWQISHTLITPG